MTVNFIYICESPKRGRKKYNIVAILDSNISMYAFVREFMFFWFYMYVTCIHSHTIYWLKFLLALPPGKKLYKL